MIGRHAAAKLWRRLRMARAGSIPLQYAVLAALVSGVSVLVSYTSSTVAAEKLKAVAAALNRMPY